MSAEPRTATRFSENVNSGEDASDAGAAAQSGEDAAAFYKDLWRQNKIETYKQKKEIAGLQAFLKTMMMSASETESESIGQSSNWDWSYTDHGWHDAAPWQWAGQASSQSWDWSHSVDSNPVHVPVTAAPYQRNSADEVRTGSAEEDQAGAKYSWPDPLTARDPWNTHGAKDWSWASNDWRQSGCKDWGWSAQSYGVTATGAAVIPGAPSTAWTGKMVPSPRPTVEIPQSGCSGRLHSCDSWGGRTKDGL